MSRHPSRTDAGFIAMVVDDYPGKMKIAGRVVRLGNHEMQNLADGRVFERFEVKLYDTSTPYGDRYQETFKIASMYLELCNISDASSYCYEHGREHNFTTDWSIPTPPKFKSVEEADRWMAQQAEKQRVRENIQALHDDFDRADGAVAGTAWRSAPNWGIASSAYDPNVTPPWPCLIDPCAVHGCVGPHLDVPVGPSPGSYSVVVRGQSVPVQPGQTITIAGGTVTWTQT